MNELTRFSLLDIPIDNVTMDQALDKIITSIKDKERTSELNFVNAHCINVSYTDMEYKQILLGSDAVFADGSGIRMAGDMFGTKIIDNVNGTDMFPLLCRRCKDEGFKIFLLGAAPGTAQRVGEWVHSEIAPDIISGVHDGFFNPEDIPSLISEIEKSEADLLLVAMGVPRQEKWIHQNLKELPVSATLGVGGLFDFFSGNILRAPMWMRKLGIEWVWRLLKEPRRMWKRYIVGNIVFTHRVKQAVKKSKRQ